MNKTYLITGGAGFIGSNFVEYLYRKYKNIKIIVLDLLTYAGNVENIPVEIYNSDRFEFYYGDIRNLSLVENLVGQSDYVVHFAAETHVTRSIFDNKNFFETDVIGTQAICHAVLKFKDKINRFVHISTSEVYGTSINNTSMNENHPLIPLSPYAAAKTGADRLVYSYISTYDIPAVILRPFNNYGPKQHLEKAIPRFITSVILNENLKIHGEGKACRDWIYVTDTCVAIDLVLNADINLVKGEIFNVGTNISYSIREIADMIVEIMSYDKKKIIFIKDRPGQVDFHKADCSKLKSILDWTPKVDFLEGLKETVDWYINNKKLWEKQIWLREVPIILKDGTKVMH